MEEKINLSKRRLIYCCECKITRSCEKTSGDKIYRHRKDLAHLVFWQCVKCKNYVGSHKKSGLPLGCIPNAEIKNARQHIHALIDPVWKSGKISRGELYRRLSLLINKEYHTAEIRNIETARFIYREAKKIIATLK